MLSVYVNERRSEARLDVRMPAKIILGNGEVLCHTSNISPGGLLLECSTELVTDRALQVLVLMPGELLQGQDRWVRCEVEITRTERIAEQQRFAIAAKVLKSVPITSSLESSHRIKTPDADSR